MELWGFKSTGSGYPQIFSSPSGETMRQTPKRFRAAKTCSRSSITVPSLVGLGFHPPPGQPKTLNVFVTYNNAQSVNCRYLIYSEADFEVFRPSVATRCTDGGEIWHGEGDLPLFHAKFHPHRCNDKGVGPQKRKFLLIFDQNVEYKRPAVSYPLRDFHEMCRFCTSFQDALGVKTSLDLLKGIWGYRGFKLRGSGFPRNFSAP